MVKIIERSVAGQLQELLGFFPAVGLVGARQVGKTTLAKTFSQNMVYLDLEDDRDRAKIQGDPLFFFQQYSDRTVILDEVQQMPDIFRVLRGVIDADRRPGRFILLGSASPVLLKQTAESLAGRIAYLELNPLYIEELSADILWKDLWLRGGFPESLLAPSDALSSEWRRSFIRSYTERDLPSLGLSAEPIVIRRFWQMLAGDNAGQWQSEKYANSLGIHHATVKRYADFLEHAYLIDRLDPWFPNVTKRLVKSAKVYQSDTGLLHNLLNINTLDELLGTAQLGASWEGFVIQQIKTALRGRLECYFYRTHQGAECDLVLVSGNQPVVGIEIKFGATPSISKGFYTSIEDLKTPHNFVVISEGASFQLKENVWVVNLTDFLKDHLPKFI